MYFNCHTHTEFSNITTGLDSTNRIDNIISYGKEIGLRGCVITDHDNLSNAVEISKHLADEDFKLAIGNEIYLVDEFIDDDKIKQNYYHFILIALDKLGYEALVRISSRAWYRSKILRNKRRVPTLKSDLEKLIPQYRGHIVAASACLGGQLADFCRNNDLSGAKGFVKWATDLFGDGNFFIEMQSSKIEDQIKYNNYLIEHFKDYPKIITTDAHYLKRIDFPIFEAFLRSEAKNANREVKEFYDYAYLQSADEVRNTMQIPADEIEKAFANSVAIMNRCQPYSLEQTQIIPKVPLSEIELTISDAQLAEAQTYPTIAWGINHEDLGTRYCIRYCLNSLKDKGLWSKKYLERFEEEAEVHKYQSEKLDSNFFNYVNCCQWLIETAWSIDCAVGPARGSGGGCLINFLMNVTQIDPVRYDLKFWRYLNKVRVTPLDIDSDYQPSKKKDLYAAIRNARGELGMAQVATFRTLTLKAAILTACRGYRSYEYPQGIAPDDAAALSAMIEAKRGFVATLNQTINGDNELGFKPNTEFLNACKQYPGLLDIVQLIEGIVVGSSTHASAIILFDNEDRWIDHCSIMRAPNGDLCTAFDLHTIEYAGAFKLDVLWLSTLDTQATTFKLLQQHNVIDPNMTLRQCFQKYIDVNKIDYNNPALWEALYNGSVLSVFQFDAPSGKNGVGKMHPTSLEEMTFLNAAIRLITPKGQEGQIERAIRLKGNLDVFEAEMQKNGVDEKSRQILHEELDKTNGCCAGQETFMTLLQRLVGYELKDAEVVRKAVAKKKIELVEEEKQKFFQYAKKSGYAAATCDYLWNLIVEPSKSYSFNMSHGVSYSMIGVQCLLLGSGVLFPPIYWNTAVLLQKSGALDDGAVDYNKIAKAIAEVQKYTNVVAPSVNMSAMDFTLNESTNTIYMGLGAIKGVRDDVIEKILTMRPFSDYWDFIERVAPDTTSAVALIAGGCLDDFGERQELIETWLSENADTKSKLTMANLAKIIEYGLLPQELDRQRRLFNFTKYLKAHKYHVDDRARTYLDNNGFEMFGDDIDKSEWDVIYKNEMQEVKQWLVKNHDSVLEEINNKAIDITRNRYFPSDIPNSLREIKALGVCFGDHPLTPITTTNFYDLPATPDGRKITNGNKTWVIYPLVQIVGVVIAKDKMHETVTLSTKYGVVNAKFQKGQFNEYDKQISEVMNDGSKKVLERSWFDRGNVLQVQGYRRDDLFVTKHYKNSQMQHAAYLVTNLDPMQYQTERKTF